mgnify:CR=1 FL=1
MTQKNNRQLQHKVTWAESFRDIAITSINRGQILPFIMTLITLFILYKLPPEAIERIVTNVFEGQLAYVAPILLIGVLFAWFFHCKKLRRQFSKEFERIGREKSKLQRKNHHKNFNSSNRR